MPPPQSSTSRLVELTLGSPPAAWERLGFVVEGYARDYLLIDDRWQDQILTSLINPDWHPAQASGHHHE